jgi:hypothetical protein
MWSAAFGGAGVSSAVRFASTKVPDRRRDAGATKPRSLRKIRMGAESMAHLLRENQNHVAPPFFRTRRFRFFGLVFRAPRAVLSPLVMRNNRNLASRDFPSPAVARH